ncbi:expressed protein [Phakopsora pachyrhizi]|uniref:Expressed protein n=1 Tax=Phakopsora pachyrhizi TaxID=170000 RepID=A0AAV0BIM4_PHAPC|nr:expressed protein [Phakopsora pachyrhizi]
MSSAGDAQDSRGSEHGGAKPTPGPSRARSPSSHHPSSLAARSVFINGTPRHSLVSQSSRYSSSSSPFSSNGHSKDALITNGSSSGLQSQPTFLDDDQRSITRATSTILNDSFSSGSHQMSSSLPLSQAAPPCLPGSVPIRQTQLLDRPASSPLLTVPSLSESTSPSTSANLISSKPIRPSKFTPEGALPSVTLDPLPHEKSNYKCRYDPALDTSVVKKSAGPLYTHFKPSRSIISFPDRDPRLRLAYPTPIKSMPKTPAGRSALVAGLSRSSRGRQTYHSQVERLASYSYDRNSTGPPPPPPPAAVLITRLNKLVTGEQVRNHFSQFGRIAECELKLDPQMGGSLGICWLKFVDELNQTFEAGRSNISLKCRALSSANRGLQDGHRSALEAVKKADGARIGIMLTMGASQQTSSLRKPFRNVTPVGIKCVLDGEGKKCARAVDNELQKLYPPLPLYSPSHETTAGDDIIPPTSLNSLASQIHPTPSCFGTKQLEVRPPSPGGMPSLIERENSGVNSLNYPQISYQTPLQGHSDAANVCLHHLNVPALHFFFICRGLELILSVTY